jgi:hypothetical protein
MKMPKMLDNIYALRHNKKGNSEKALYFQWHLSIYANDLIKEKIYQTMP